MVGRSRGGRPWAHGLRPSPDRTGPGDGLHHGYVGPGRLWRRSTWPGMVSAPGRGHAFGRSAFRRVPRLVQSAPLRESLHAGLHRGLWRSPPPGVPHGPLGLPLRPLGGRSLHIIGRTQLGNSVAGNSLSRDRDHRALPPVGLPTPPWGRGARRLGVSPGDGQRILLVPRRTDALRGGPGMYRSGGDLGPGVGRKSGRHRREVRRRCRCPVGVS